MIQKIFSSLLIRLRIVRTLVVSAMLERTTGRDNCSKVFETCHNSQFRYFYLDLFIDATGAIYYQFHFLSIYLPVFYALCCFGDASRGFLFSSTPQQAFQAIDKSQMGKKSTAYDNHSIKHSARSFC